MHGQIHVNSVPGEGSTFRFSVRLKRGQAQTANSGNPPAPARLSLHDKVLDGLYLLLAEDNELLQAFECQLLTSLGATVVTVADGEKAVALALNPAHRFDAVLMDIQMPRIDGLEATRRIRSRHGPDSLPIIAMTAHAMESERQRSLDAGMNDHLSKPINPEALVATLLRWVQPSGRQGAPRMDVTASPAELPQLPGIDLAAALQQLGGKYSLLHKLLLRMRKDYRDAARQIQAELDAGNDAEAMRLAHSLKGVAATLHISQLQKAAAAIEASLAANDRQGADLLMPALLRAMEETHASLALLPLGTANDFCRAAGIPLLPAEALALLECEPRPIDLGEVDGQLFLNMATGGFGSRVTANTSEELKKLLGSAAYFLTGLSRFAEVHSAFGRFGGPGFAWEGDFLALGIGNGRQAGGGHVLCPQAQVDDGLLDVCIVPASQDVVGTLGTLLSGSILGLETVSVSARLPWLEVEAPEGLDINLDGEPLESRHLRFAARPGALRVHLPDSSPLLGGGAGGVPAA